MRLDLKEPLLAERAVVLGVAVAPQLALQAADLDGQVVDDAAVVLGAAALGVGEGRGWGRGLEVWEELVRDGVPWAALGAAGLVLEERRVDWEQGLVWDTWLSGREALRHGPLPSMVSLSRLADGFWLNWWNHALGSRRIPPSLPSADESCRSMDEDVMGPRFEGGFGRHCPTEDAEGAVLSEEAPSAGAESGDTRQPAAPRRRAATGWGRGCRLALGQLLSGIRWMDSVISVVSFKLAAPVA